MGREMRWELPGRSGDEVGQSRGRKSVKTAGEREEGGRKQKKDRAHPDQSEHASYVG